MVKEKEKNIAKPCPTKPTTPTTRASTRATIQKAKEKAKEKKKATEQKGLVKKKHRRKYIAQLDTDDERT